MPQERTDYPLTNAQRLMYIMLKYSMKKSVIDICAMLHFDCETEPKLLMQAVYLGLMRNQSSAVRIRKVGKEIRQYLYEGGPEQIPVLDYSARLQAELDADLDKWSQTAFPNGSMDCQLYRAKLIHEPNGYYGIYFCVSHLAFDAYTLMGMATDILQIYTVLRDGGAVPPKKGDYLTMMEKDIAYLGSEKEKQDVAYHVANVYGVGADGSLDEPYGTQSNPKIKRVKGTRRVYFSDLLHPKAHHVNLPIPAAFQQNVEGLAAELHISPLCVYLLGLRSYLSHVNDRSQDVVLNMIISRRGSLVEKYGGGTHALGQSIRLKLDGKLSVRDALLEISKRELGTLMHAGSLLSAPSALAKPLYHASTLEGYSSFCFTYNPFRVRFPEGMKGHMNIYSTGGNPQSVYLSIMALDDSGDLTANYDVNDNMTQPDTPNRMYTYMMQAIEYAVAHLDEPVENLSRL